MVLGDEETAIEGTEAVVEVEVSGSWMKTFPACKELSLAVLGLPLGVLCSRGGQDGCGEVDTTQG